MVIVIKKIEKRY